MLAIRTCPLRRYRIEGSLPAPASEAMTKRLTDRRFLPLAAREESTYGWVTADNLLLTSFDADTILRGELVVLGLRIDRRRVNARLLRAQLDLEVRARSLAAEDGQAPRRVSREEKSELRQHLAQELLRQTSPSVDAFTVLIDPRRKQVNLLSLSKRAHEVLGALFVDTFECSLSPLTPYRRAQELLSEPRGLDLLDRTAFWPAASHEGLEASAGSLAEASDRRLPT